MLCTDPHLTPAAFRAIARRAGCHIYTDEDSILFGDNSFLSAFAKQKTHTVLRLKGKVYEGAELPLELAENEFVVLQYT